MKLSKIFAFAALSLVAACGSSVESVENYTQYVNPFIGTDGPGNTYPGAQVPFGMVQLSPDNGVPGWDRISGYFYPDSTIGSFSMTHLSGTGAGDLYDIAFLPVTRPWRDAREEGNTSGLRYYSKFSHEKESAKPGYYSVFLDDYGIEVELTATERCGFQRYKYSTDKPATVILDLDRAMNWDFTMDTKIEVVDSVTIRGYRHSKGWANNQKLFFTAQFSKPFVKSEFTSRDIALRGDSVGVGITGFFDFDVKAGDEVLVRTAISAVSEQNAAENLKAEIDSWNFNAIYSAANDKWNSELSKIEVSTPSIDEKTVFYTCLYQSMLAPTIYMDVNGEYRGADYEVHKAEDFVNYTRFSLWDTYRAAHPLYTIMHPERVNDMVKSFIVFFDQHGFLPVWNFEGQETDMMLGYHSVPVIVDAYLKGIGDFDAKKALAACVATGNKDEYRSIGEYKKLGYVPYDMEHESLSKTLEYAYDDYCIALMAEKMGETAIAEEFFKRAESYKNIYNKENGWIQPRHSDGSWITDFNPDLYTKHISESNAWHYFFSVPHDIEGLRDIMGGEESFRARLDSMFTHKPGADEKLPIFSTGMIGQYAHGNEPSHHVAYLYNWTKEPWKTQKYAREIMATQYSNEPYGHCGNEDCGQMSSWYVFSAMGFYPVDPASGVYALGSPILDKAVINLPNHKQFVMTSENNSPENIYVQSVLFNGKPYDSLFITQRDIMEGGALHFVMGSTKRN